MFEARKKTTSYSLKKEFIFNELHLKLNWINHYFDLDMGTDLSVNDIKNNEKH